MWLGAASIVQRHLPLALEGVQLWIRIGTVAIARATRAEHHVAAIHGTLVHLTQMHGGEVDFEGTLITEGLEADVALRAFLTRDGVDVLGAEVGCGGRGSVLGGSIVCTGRITVLAAVAARR